MGSARWQWLSIIAVIVEGIAQARVHLALFGFFDPRKERDRRLLFDLAFEAAPEPNWEEAESCLAVLRRRRLETGLRSVQAEIEAHKAGTDTGPESRTELMRLFERKQLEAGLRSVQTEIEALETGRSVEAGAEEQAKLLRLLEKKQTLRASLDRLEG